MSQKLGFFIRKSDASGKTISSLMPLVDVAATLIVKNDRILAVYNKKWSSFTIPLTKRKVWNDPGTDKDESREEEWEDAAVRAAAEWIGRTLTNKPELLMDVAEFQQSDRDAKWKRYRMRAFTIRVDQDTEPPPGRITEWLTADEFLDEKRKPISPTARHIVAELKHNGIL